jgi:N4-gp56 family major capsid protein
MTNYTDVTPRTNTYIEARMLKYAGPVQVLQHTAMMKRMPKNKTQTITFRRPEVFAAATTPLVEGVAPSATAFAYTDVSATLSQYGQIVEFTDVIEMTHEDPVVNDMARQAGDNIGRTIEALDWAIVRSGTNIVYTNGSARTDVNTPLALTKLRSATRTLKRNKASKFREVVASGPNYATRAIEASWIAVGHVDLDSDIRNLPGFIPCAQYGTRQMICPEEIGAVEDIRFALEMDSESVKPSIIPADSRPEKSDPLGQKGIVGWKTWHVAKILNNAWMVRIEAAVTAL